MAKGSKMKHLNSTNNTENRGERSCENYAQIDKKSDKK